MNAQPQRVEESSGDCRRAHERMQLSLHGVFFTEDRLERHCLVLDVSPGGARVATGEAPAVGQKLIMKLASLGQIKAEVVRSSGTEMGVRFLAHSSERRRLAASIAWNYNKSRLGASDRRGEERELTDGCDPVEFEDGEIVPASIIDISIAGVAFKCDRQTKPGDRVRIGALTGTIVRVIDDGFAVSFDPPSGG